MTAAPAESVSLLRELIEIPSVSSDVSTGQAEAIDYIAARLDEAEVPYEIVGATSQKKNLIARWPGRTREGALLVHGHVDVVDAVEEEWSTPPFSAEIRDGMIFGRGAADMKCFVAVMLAVLRRFGREGFVPERDIVFAFFCDEEVGGALGAGWVVEERPALLDGVVEAIGEVGGFSFTGDDGSRYYPVATGERGVTNARIVAEGRAGHASMPAEDHAIGCLLKALTRLDGHCFGEGRPERRVRSEGIPEALSVMRAAGRATTVVPTVLTAGYQNNVVPGEASAELNCRTPPGTEQRAFHEEVEAALGDSVTVEWGPWIAPIESAESGELMERIANQLRVMDPKAVLVPIILPASSDAKHLARLGIGCYGFVPLRTPPRYHAFEQFHAADECIPISSLEFCEKFLLEMLQSPRGTNEKKTGQVWIAT